MRWRLRSTSGFGVGIALTARACRDGRGRSITSDGGSEFDDLSEIHHGNAIGDVFHDRQIVRDEDEREIHLPAKLRKQIQDLRLDRNIERRHGFIGDDHLGIQRERARDRDALTLSAGKFVRIFLHESRRESDGSHQLGHARG